MLCEILKPIQAAEGFLETGQVVDVSTWRWVKQLIEQKKLRPVLVHAASLPEVEAKIASRKRGRPRKTEIQ